MPFKPLKVDPNALGEFDNDRVSFGAAVANAGDLLACFYYPLSEEESRGQLGIVAGGPHRDGDRPMRAAGRAKSDLKRLFDGKRVRELVVVRAGFNTSNGG